MSKVQDLEIVADMVGLDVGYVVEAAQYFTSMNEAFHWLYVSEENPLKPFTQEELINRLASITTEDLEEEKANSVAEYMVYTHDHTYIGEKGIAYLRIQR